MSESFAELFEESLKTVELKAGSIITGVVVDIDSEWVTVHAGLKSEGVIPRTQFLNESGELEIEVGSTVKIRDIRAFLPGSLVDVRPLKDNEQLEGQVLDFKVIKLDQKRNNVVVSRRSVLESENSEEREKLLKSLQEGHELKAIV